MDIQARYRWRGRAARSSKWLGCAAACGGLARSPPLGRRDFFTVTLVLFERWDGFGFPVLSLGCLLALRFVTLLSHASESWQSGGAAAWPTSYLRRLAATKFRASAKFSLMLMRSHEGESGEYSAENVPDEGPRFGRRSPTGLAFADPEGG